MAIKLGNAPCSWGVEFPDDPRNPMWETVLQDCAKAGYTGIELGPVGYMPEDPEILGAALETYGLTLIGGVVFQPFHDPLKWDALQDNARRTCQAVQAHGGQNLVLIDSIAPSRVDTAGRPDEAVQMSQDEWSGFVSRINTIARMATDEYGLCVGLHPHAAGFMDFLPEVMRILDETDPHILGLCVDTGHCQYAGFDPVSFLRDHIKRVSYVHFKTTDPVVKAHVIENRIGFYDACGQGLFCNLDRGEVDFKAVRDVLIAGGYDGWCTVEQDCDPTLDVNPTADARTNRDYLMQIGF